MHMGYGRGWGSLSRIFQNEIPHTTLFSLLSQVLNCCIKYQVINWFAIATPCVHSWHSMNQCVFYPLLCWFIFGDLGAVNWVRINSCDAALIELVPWLIQMLVSDWAQKIFLCSIRSQLLSCFLDLLIWRSFPATSTICWTCLACAESCLQEEFSVKMGPTKLKKFYNWYIFHLNSYIYYACSKFVLFHTNMYGW